MYETNGHINNGHISTETNLGKWMFYMSDCVSPDSFIKWSFYGLIAAALERRVWNGHVDKPLYCNLYIVLVAPPGVGKDQALTPIKEALRFHKSNKKNLMDTANAGPTRKRDDSYDPTVIQVGAEATTYEALVLEMSNCVRGGTYKDTNHPNLLKLYTHCSLAFCLGEMSSLFRKHTEDLVNFLLVTYDCGDYRYNTISRGSDHIKRCCLNFIAGTTPGFIKTIFGDELITTGFASRTFFIVENESRFRSIEESTFTEAQLKSNRDILDHIKKLTGLFGQVNFTEEAKDYLRAWWIREPKERVNRSSKLLPYYARKNIHVKKLAMVLHFCDNATMEVGLKYVLQAIVELEIIEIKMHGAVTLDNKNPLAGVTESIYAHLKSNGPQRKEALLLDMWGELPEQEKSLDTVINYLQKSKRIKQNLGKYEITI